MKTFSLSDCGPEDVEMSDTKVVNWVEAYVPPLIKQATIKKRLAAINHRWSEKTIKKAIDPFAEGEQRITYHGRIVDSNSKKNWSAKIVLKEFKRLEEDRDRREDYIEIMETQSTAAYLSTEFNKVSPERQKKIQFLQVRKQRLFDYKDYRLLVKLILLYIYIYIYFISPY